MSLSALLLVLAAACCHATWNYLIKRINGGPELVWLFSILAVPIYLPVVVGLWVYDPPDLGLVEYGLILGSALLHLGYFLLLQRGYRVGDLSLVYPTARATGPFLSTLFAVIVLQEALSPAIMIGGGAIIIGVFFLTGGIRKSVSGQTTSLLFGLSAGTLIGCYTVWDAYTVAAMAVPPLILDYASSLLRSTVLAPYAYKHRQRVRDHWRDHRVRLFIIAVTNPLAYILVLVALTFTPVIYVAPAREVSVLLTVIAGAVLLGERDIRKRLGWGALIVFGISMLAVG